MIERQIIKQKMKEREIQDFVFSFLGRLSCSKIKLQRTPLGERITVYTARPGLIVGRKGANIKELTIKLKELYGMENPQIEVAEIENLNLDATSVAKSLVASFERFGAKRFKVICYKALENIINAGALGAEIIVSGRGVPGARAKSWRFYQGHLKKSGDISENYVDKAIETSDLKTGTIGIKVSILHPDIKLPDRINFKEEKDEEVKEKLEGSVEEKKEVEVIKKARTRKKKEKSDDVKIQEEDSASEGVENGQNKE